jgi:hypothetical protein
MRAIVITAVLATQALVVLPAIAEDGTQNISVKRQMVLCMNKSMSANKTLSYNDAERDCKQNVLARNPIATAKRSLTANAADTPTLKNP